MKEQYRIVQLGSRDGMFYCKDTQSGSRTSLKTKDRKEAERLVRHKNEALKNPHINRKIGMAYLSAADPRLVRRIWQEVMEDIIQDKQGPTLHRWETAIKDPAFNLIRKKVVVMTAADDFMAVLRAGTVCTNVYLRRIQNHCLDMGWLPVPILPKKKFPKIKHKEQRAITWDEHCRIAAREGNAERRDFYELCWHFGGSQSDIASLQAADLDYEKRGFSYNRLKTSSLSGCRIGPKAWEVILRRPRQGPLFPYLITIREGHRATEFKQRCEGLGIKDHAPLLPLCLGRALRRQWLSRALRPARARTEFENGASRLRQESPKAIAFFGGIRGGHAPGGGERQDCNARDGDRSPQGGLSGLENANAKYQNCC
jgi:hypothetical protein